MIGIVGGGLTGLTLGHHLAAEGVDHLVLEAAASPGGVVRSIEVEGRVLEVGPQRARLTADLFRLIEAVGLADQLLEVPAGLPLFILSRGRLRRAPLSFGSFVATDLISPAGKLRMLVEPLTRGVRPGEDVASFLTRKFGRQAYERFLGPLYGGLYASDPSRMEVELSLAHALRELGVKRSLLLSGIRGRQARGGGAPACSFVTGLQALPRALLEADRESIHLDTPVRELDRRSSDGAFILVTERGEVPVRTAVLTLPAPDAAELLRTAAPDPARRLASLRYNPLAVVHLLVDYSDAVARLRGYGYQVAFGEPAATRGVTWNHAMFPDTPNRRGIFTAYLGGMADPRIVEEPDDRLGMRAAEEFHEATGVAARPLHVHRTRVPAWDRSWRALDDLVLPDGLVLEAAYTARPGIPGRLSRARARARALIESGGPSSR